MNLDFVNRRIEFSRNELINLQEWKPFIPGYNGDDAQTYQNLILPIVSKICKIHNLNIRIKGAAADTFEAVFFHSDDIHIGQNKGYTICFNLYTPIAAFSRGTITIGKDFWTLPNIHDPIELIDPSNCGNEFEKSVIDLLESNGTYVLTVKNALELLPEDIVPYEYCSTPEPWNKLFNLLFSSTD
ncbi:hypothetical protein EHQ94_07020 [Leptospira meyeri]|uniref:hypothetical protein n=1 Tax=Leptospira meyeri TaxID=29508 RepID=UPI0010834D84|nr:hypothetical protein [Leptospira meyeri]TGM68654.1 hypothetical protein EHQ93_00035 [Leptospira meyeri]TGM70593.1 hypothetical protein EHQ94_07020 [Leptospira meyeri]